MKIVKFCVVGVLWLLLMPVQAIPEHRYYSDPDTVIINDTLIITDDFDSMLHLKQQKDYTWLLPLNIDSLMVEIERKKPNYSYLTAHPQFLSSSPFFSELVFNGYHMVLDTFKLPSVDLFLEQQKRFLFPAYGKPVDFFAVERNIIEARSTVIRHIALYNPGMIAFRVDKLPDVSDLINFQIEVKEAKSAVRLVKPDITPEIKKINIEKMKRNPWTKQSMAMLQFSQNYISKNWYQGGSDNIAILGILNGRFNYDNKKNIQWENFAEWRLGLNSVEGDTLRFLNTNDDIIRATSKLGVKAGGNWFYSANLDFSTHFFNSFRGVNSKQMKATLLTPVRFNLGVGMDYKYKKALSLYVSPLTYKFIYANDTVNVNQKSFGIPTGERVLSQLGSSFRLQNSFTPSREIQIDSKLTFYTNYEKVEIDWEIVSNFTVNRFLSTRLSLNPRYDNTVIFAKGEKAKLQFKELLTFGLSYRLL